MPNPSPWITDDRTGILTDLYELTMLQAYWAEGMTGEAVFDLFVRRLPDQRNYLVACGLNDALRYLESLRLTDRDRASLASLGRLDPGFLDWLADFRFTGDVFAVPEGTILFANEPVLEVVAPIAEAQVVESFLLNQVNFQTVLASKAARVADAARGRHVSDFGMRRMHGTDAAMKGARAFYVGGVTSTSNVRAGLAYGIPVVGTMAHSYVQAHATELDAFRAFARAFPDTTLLVDTYDTLKGVAKVVRLARELGSEFKVRAVRLDSGDLEDLSRRARSLLDEAGLGSVQIFASGGLDEHTIDRLMRAGAPIDGFGVGSRMGVASDVPVLDSAYKLVAYDDVGRMKLSTGKATLPGRKQVFRVDEGTPHAHDVLALHGESLQGRPLLRPVMVGGVRTEAGREDVERARRRRVEELGQLPPQVRALEPCDPPYEVRVSPALERETQAARARLGSV